MSGIRYYQAGLTLTDQQTRNEIPSDSSGAIFVNSGNLNVTDDKVEASPPSYQAAFFSASALFTAAASASDIFSIIGSATKTIYVMEMGIQATQTTAGHVDVVMIKRTTASTGGTLVAANMVQHDSSLGTATAVVQNLTANYGATGTSAGGVGRYKLFIPAPATAARGDRWVTDFRANPMKLRGVAQSLNYSLSSATVTGNSFVCWAKWYEV